MANGLLIDGNNIVLRVWFAQSGARKAIPDAAAVAGVVASQVAKWCAVAGCKPHQAIVTFDADHGRGWRYDLLPEYKANRRANPPAPELKASQDAARELARARLHAMGVKEITAEGWEADDVLATLARLHGEASRKVVVVSSDRDLLQCISAWCAVASAAAPIERASLITEARWLNDTGWPARYVADYKAMTGDKSDNIPPAGGLGEKSADLLLKRYGGIDELGARLADIEADRDLGKRVRNALTEHQSTLLRNYQMTKLRADVPGVALPVPTLPPASVLQPGWYLVMPAGARLHQVAIKPEDAAKWGKIEPQRPTVYQIEAVCPADDDRAYPYARVRVISSADPSSGRVAGQLIIWAVEGLLTTLAYDHAQLTDERPAFLVEAERKAKTGW